MIVIKNDGAVEKKLARAKLLNKYSIDDRVEILNKHYAGKLKFKADASNSSLINDIISIDEIDQSIDILELPYVEDLSISKIPLFYYNENADILNRYGRNNLRVVKLPKQLKEFIVDYSISSWLKNIDRLFMWDSTYIDFSRFDPSYSNNLQMVIIQSSEGNKPKIIRF